MWTKDKHKLMDKLSIESFRYSVTLNPNGVKLLTQLETEFSTLKEDEVKFWRSQSLKGYPMSIECNTYSDYLRSNLCKLN